MNDNTPKFYDDDGTEFNPNLFPKPSLCATCQKDSDPTQEIPCNLNRADQQGEDEFQCYAYEPNTDDDH